MSAAQAAHAAGDLRESERMFRQLTAVNAEDWEAKLFLGIVVAKKGDGTAASRLLQEVLGQNPSSFEAQFWLSILRRKEGRLPEAIELARKAAALQPQSPIAQNNLGVCEMEARNLEGAAAAFARSSQLRPNDPTVLFNLGTCLGLVGRDEQALEILRRAAGLAPNSLDIRLLIAKTLLNLNELGGAIKEGYAALRLDPNSASVHRLLGLALMHQGRAKAAREHVDRALAIEPNEGSAYATLGSILQSSGSIAESNEAFRRSIELEPKQGHAYFSLVHNHRLCEEDREILTRMEGLVAEGALPPKEVSSLEYGLGKGYEDLAEYEKAMTHYDEANRLARRLKFGGSPYDARQASAATDLKMRRYTRAFFEAACPRGLMTDVPIFIVGMMRSGTTLVEQILSSHPDVAAGGEQEFWSKRGLECIGSNGEPDLVKLRVLSREYQKHLVAIDPEALHVTDKMPANYLYLGLIHAAFPNARIVHTRRSPADTAISIYATPNRARIDYAHDKASIVAAYKEYARLMDHWRTVLPADRFMEVRYEDLVDDRGKVTRALAEFLDLPWHDSMLTPESNDRSVVTPSVWQVRQPMYRTSIERWRRFEPWLGPFGELLELQA